MFAAAVTVRASANMIIRMAVVHIVNVNRTTNTVLTGRSYSISLGLKP